MAESDWKPLTVTMTKRVIDQTGREEPTFDFENQIMKGQWVEYDGPQMPDNGLVKGLKGIVVEDEDLIPEEIWWLPRENGNPLDWTSSSTIKVRWMDYTTLPDNELTVGRDWIKPCEPVVEKGTKVLNINDSVVYKSTINMGE